MRRAIAWGVMLTVLSVSVAAAQGIPRDKRQSGFDTMRPDTKEMQQNDRLNPATLWVRDGERLWSEPPPGGAPACGGCHGAAGETMRGVAARYPAFHAGSGAARTLDDQIRACRSERQKAPEWAYESRPLLAMSAYIGLQSRGMPIAPPDDPRLQPQRAAGEAMFNQRMGQLNLSCAGCHDANWGKKLGGSLIPQAHPTGYPIYRLEWQGMGSLQRRLRSCLTGVRAEPYPFGAAEWTALELYLQQRAAGMVVETPAVRP